MTDTVNKQALLRKIRTRKAAIEETISHHTGRHRHHLNGQHSALVDLEWELVQGTYDNATPSTPVQGYRTELTELRQIIGMDMDINPSAKGVYLAKIDRLLSEPADNARADQGYREVLEEIREFVDDRSQWPYEAEVRHQFGLLAKKMNGLQALSQPDIQPSIPADVIENISKCRSGNSDSDVIAIAISDDNYRNYESMQGFARENFGAFLRYMAATTEEPSINSTEDDQPDARVKYEISIERRACSSEDDQPVKAICFQCRNEEAEVVAEGMCYDCRMAWRS